MINRNQWNWNRKAIQKHLKIKKCFFKKINNIDKIDKRSSQAKQEKENTQTSNIKNERRSSLRIPWISTG